MKSFAAEYTDKETENAKHVVFPPDAMAAGIISQMRKVFDQNFPFFLCLG